MGFKRRSTSPPSNVVVKRPPLSCVAARHPDAGSTLGRPSLRAGTLSGAADALRRERRLARLAPPPRFRRALGRRRRPHTPCRHWGRSPPDPVDASPAAPRPYSLIVPPASPPSVRILVRLLSGGSHPCAAASQFLGVLCRVRLTARMICADLVHRSRLVIVIARWPAGPHMNRPTACPRRLRRGATSTSTSSTPTPTATPGSTSRPSGWSAWGSARASPAGTARRSTAPTRPATTASSSRSSSAAGWSAGGSARWPSNEACVRSAVVHRPDTQRAFRTGENIPPARQALRVEVLHRRCRSR